MGLGEVVRHMRANGTRTIRLRPEQRLREQRLGMVEVPKCNRYHPVAGVGRSEAEIFLPQRCAPQRSPKLASTGEQDHSHEV